MCELQCKYRFVSADFAGGSLQFLSHPQVEAPISKAAAAVVHSGRVSWSTPRVQPAPCMIFMSTCNPRSTMVCPLASLKGVRTARNYDHDFKSCARVTVAATPHYLWMFLSFQGRSGAWKYLADACYGGMGTGQGNSTASPLRHGVMLRATCLFRRKHFSHEKRCFFISWKSLSKELWRVKSSREQSCTEGLAGCPARSWCSGSMSPWWTPGFLTVSVPRTLLWKPDCMCSCASWPPK